MVTPEKAVPAALMVPGGAGIGYVTYKYVSTPEEIRKIAELEKSYGGCYFWFTKSKNNKEGWYKEQAVYAEELRSPSGTDTSDRIIKFIEQLGESSGSTHSSENNTIKEKCTEKPGGIVEVKWYQSKWSFDEGWSDTHNLPS